VISELSGSGVEMVKVVLAQAQVPVSASRPAAMSWLSLRMRVSYWLYQFKMDLKGIESNWYYQLVETLGS